MQRDIRCRPAHTNLDGVQQDIRRPLVTNVLLVTAYSCVSGLVAISARDVKSPGMPEWWVMMLRTVTMLFG